MSARFVVFVVLLALVAGVCTTASAEVSWFGLIGKGSDQQEVAARMSLRTTSGSPVGSDQFVISVPRGEGLRAQVIFAGDGDSRRYRVEYSCDGAPGGRYRQAEYSDAGWVFEIPEWRLYRGVDTPFHIRVQDLKGKRNYIRILFFTIGTGHSAVTANEALFIRVVEPEPSVSLPPVASAQPTIVADPVAIDENFARVGSSVVALSEQQQRLADAINLDQQKIADLEAKVTAQDRWIQEAIAVSQTQQVATTSTPATSPASGLTITGLEIGSVLEVRAPNDYKCFRVERDPIKFPGMSGTYRFRLYRTEATWRQLTVRESTVVNYYNIPRVQQGGW